MKYYKIHMKGTETFLQGVPTHYLFDKEGRTFKRIDGLRTFLKGFMENTHRKTALSDIEILEYKVVVKGIHEVIEPEQLVRMLKE